MTTQTSLLALFSSFCRNSSLICILIQVPLQNTQDYSVSPLPSFFFPFLLSYCYYFKCGINHLKKSKVWNKLLEIYTHTVLLQKNQYLNETKKSNKTEEILSYIAAKYILCDWTAELDLQMSMFYYCKPKKQLMSLGQSLGNVFLYFAFGLHKNFLVNIV